ncbi:hypothetical protein J3458_001699 [Metarhizium acridum]|uniref:uncharacterized protein n=1 Tax=Metarhizium acridum TaxID=92637 RepID=UPI001C6C4693|nr:hypothetical protein J3458_001699 [Metarhizium acridum]
MCVLQLTEREDWLSIEVHLAAGGGGLGLEMVAGWPVGGCVEQQLASSFVNGNGMATNDAAGQELGVAERLGKDSQHQTTVEAKTGTKVEKRGTGAFAGSRRQQLERPMCWHLGPLIDSGWAHQALHFIFVSGINNSTDRPTASPTVRPSSQLPAFDRQLHCNRFGLFDLRAYPGPPQHPSTCLWSLQRQPPSPRLPRPLRLSVTKISVFERLPTSSTLSLLPTPVLKAPKLLEAFLLFGEPVFQPPISTSESYQLPHRRIPEVLPLTEEESRRPRQSTEGTVCHPFRPP